MSGVTVATREHTGATWGPPPSPPIVVSGASEPRRTYEWRLRKNLLPFFADYPLAEIDIALVERYREEKIIERDP